MKIYIMDKELRKLRYWVDKADGEVSGLGLVEIRKGEPLVTEVFLLEQECTSSSTDLDEKAVAKLLFEVARKSGTLTFWWHSHVNMGVFWSGTDDTTIKQIGGQGCCIASVFNKKGEVKTRYRQLGNEFLPSIDVDNIELVSACTDSDVTEWEKEFKEKVKSKYYGAGNHNRWSGYGDYDDSDYSHWYKGDEMENEYPAYCKQTNKNGKWEKIDNKHKQLETPYFQWNKLKEKKKDIWRRRYLWVNSIYGNELELADFYVKYKDDRSVDWKDVYNDYREFEEQYIEQDKKENKLLTVN